MPTFQPGRHENGQNFLIDRRVIDDIVALTRDTTGPIVEIGPGDGALTRPLARLNRPLTGVEIDPERARRLAAGMPGHVRIVPADFLRHRLPDAPHVVVANVPFHVTTAILRRLLRAPAWTDAILLVQWEVARRRAGVGGASMMTAQWAPWFAFELHRRVPADAFRPRPSVDGGLLVVRRRTEPLLAGGQRGRFQRLVHAGFTGPGRGIADIVARAGLLSGRAASAWAARHGISGRALPRDVPVRAWVDLFCTTGSSPPAGRVERGRTVGRSRRSPG